MLCIISEHLTCSVAYYLYGVERQVEALRYKLFIYIGVCSAYKNIDTVVFNLSEIFCNLLVSAVAYYEECGYLACVGKVDNLSVAADVFGFVNTHRYFDVVVFEQFTVADENSAVSYPARKTEPFLIFEVFNREQQLIVLHNDVFKQTAYRAACGNQH